jgi:nitrate/nitrite-specific signal transduction histidine kinase
MAKILEFPDNRSLERQLKILTDELVELHETMGKLYDSQAALDGMILEKEEAYSKVLNKYSHAIGAENIAISLLQFATDHIQVDLETGDIRYAPPKEEEEPDPEVS